MGSTKVSKRETHTVRWVKSTCKMCLHGCGIRVKVEDGVVAKIEGDPTNPDNLGKLCPKGNVGMMRLYDPKRVKAPLLRTNPNKGGPGVDPKWKEISWDQAMDIVAEKLKPIHDTDPRKLVVAVGDFQRIFNWAWPAAFGSPHFFSTVGQYCGAAYHPINGITDTSFAAVNDYEYCNYWLQIGAGDGFSSHLHLAGSAKRMADARMRGMKVVVVEPRMSPGGAKADEWIPILPGTDRAFALGLMHSLVFEHGIYDREFLKHRTNAPYLIGPDGLYQLSDNGKAMVWDSKEDRAREWDDPNIGDYALEGHYEINGVACSTGLQLFLDILKQHAPEDMEAICTVPAQTIRRIARELGEAAQIGSTITLDGQEYPYRPAAVNYYREAIAHKDGGMDAMAMKMINILLGNIDIPGGHLGVPLDIRGFFIESDAHGMLKPQPHILHPPVPFKFPADSLQLIEWFPLGMDAGHIALDAMLNPAKYAVDYRPEVLLTYHSNPVWNMPEHAKVLEAMRKFKFIISIDILVNATTEWADLILPDHTYLESTVAMSLEPPVVKSLALRQAVIPPLYNSRDATDILIDIAERVGFLDVWNNFLNLLLGLTNREDLMLSPDRKYSNEELIDRMCRAAYGDEYGLEWFKENGHRVEKRSPKETYLPYDGLRIPFYFEPVKKAGLELAKHFESTGYQWDASTYCALPSWKLSPIHLKNDDFPLYAITYKTAETNFGETMSIPVIADLTKGVAHSRGVLINPATAKQYELEDGDLVRISSQFGSIEGRASLTHTVHPQVVAIANAMSTDGRRLGTHFNALLSAGLEYSDTFTGALEATARVQLTKLGS